MAIVDEIQELFRSKGAAAYANEQVSQLQHAVQAANLAQTEKAPPSLIAAALLHDVGHLLDDGPAAKHEELGYAWLTKHFGPEVTEPVRLHVEAKRYLCATDHGYLSTLSPASLESLHLQGGPMTDAELDAFEEETFYSDAVSVRRWDDRAKVKDMTVPGLETYLSTIAQLAKTPPA